MQKDWLPAQCRRSNNVVLSRFVSQLCTYPPLFLFEREETTTTKGLEKGPLSCLHYFFLLYEFFFSPLCGVLAFIFVSFAGFFFLLLACLLLFFFAFSFALLQNCATRTEKKKKKRAYRFNICM